MHKDNQLTTQAIPKHPHYFYTFSTIMVYCMLPDNGKSIASPETVHFTLGINNSIIDLFIACSAISLLVVSPCYYNPISSVINLNTLSISPDLSFLEIVILSFNMVSSQIDKTDSVNYWSYPTYSGPSDISSLYIMLAFTKHIYWKKIVS